MKRKTQTLLLSTLFFSVLFSSCAKSDGNYPLPGVAPQNTTVFTLPTYNCRFWVKDPYDFGDQSIEVPAGILKLTIAGETKTLFYYYHEAGPTGCGGTGTLNFNLPSGLHNWTATSINGSRSWSGQIIIPEAGCAKQEIIF